MPHATSAAAVEQACRFSRHLQRLLQARPGLTTETAASLDTPLGRAELEGWLAEEPLTEDNLKPALRRLKQRAYARICARDLACQRAAGRSHRGMTLIAETAVGAALRVLQRESGRPLWHAEQCPGRGSAA